MRVSAGQTRFVAGDSVTNGISRADEALNFAKDTHVVPNKNSAAVMSDDGRTLQIVTEGEQKGVTTLSRREIILSKERLDANMNIPETSGEFAGLGALDSEISRGIAAP